MDATAKEAAHSISHNPKLQYLSSSRRDFINLNVLMNSFRKQIKNSLIMGYETYLRSLTFSKVDESGCNLYYTHQNHPIDSRILNRFSKILVMNNAEKLNMSSLGVSEDKISVVYGAVNKSLFNPGPKNAMIPLNEPEVFVLVASDCKPRKNPGKILETIRVMSKINFVIHGKGWIEEYEGVMNQLPNLTYLPFNFQNQPTLMRTASTFLSLSLLEGGPYPLLEALASGTPAVVTRTGFAEDFIEVTNGFIVETDSSVEYIAECILKALNLKVLTRSIDLTARDLSWETLAMNLYGHDN